MKYPTIMILLLALIAPLTLAGCDDGPKRLGIEKIVAVEPHHMTRAYVIFKDKNGFYYRQSFHKTATLNDGTVTINILDYLMLNEFYGPLPGREEEYKNFLEAEKRPPAN